MKPQLSYAPTIAALHSSSTSFSWRLCRCLVHLDTTISGAPFIMITFLEASPGHCVTVTAHLFAELKGMSKTTRYARRSTAAGMRRSQ